MKRRQQGDRRSGTGGAGLRATPETTQQRGGAEATQDTAGTPAPPDPALSWAEQISSWRASLPELSPAGLCDEDRLALLRELELLTRAVAGVSTGVQVAFYSSQVAAQIADGVAPSRAGKAVPDDLAQARLTSPYWGSRELTSAKALVQEMPRTLGALRAGVITALQARVITEATSCVDAVDRAEIDDRLAPRLAGASTQEIGALARSLVYEVDPAGFVARARKAAADRGVSIRPCPDVMGLLSARLPAPQAIACYHALRTTAEAMKASGDPRTLAQLMADALFERLTGRAVVDGIDVEVGLVITDEALFAGTSDPAVLLGYGPIPAQVARDLLNPATDTSAAGTSMATAERAQDDEVVDEAVRTDPVDDAMTGHTDPVEEQNEADTVAEDETDAQTDAEATLSGYCPDGPRCTSFSCTLTHGHPAASGLAAPPDLGSLRRPTDPVSTTSTSRAGSADGPSPGTDERTPEAPGDNCAPKPPEAGRDAATRAGSDPTKPGSCGARKSSDHRQNGPATEQHRPIVAPDATHAATVWVRRLYTDPVTGVLTERDSRKRLFTGALRAFLISRDQSCRNTWCGAPVRHIDHVQRHADEGSTDSDNGRGLCARCNLARERPRQLDTPPATYRPPPPLLSCLPRPAHSDVPGAAA